jgi:hypothetical protein
MQPNNCTGRSERRWDTRVLATADGNIESAFRRTDFVGCSPLVAAQMELENSPDLNCVPKMG